ncbi:ATP-binding cassette domain-containing protein [Enterobacteriaceae bacterium BIT-l23]|uniref:ATP-binding cassette domain-containing protein n=1 Tax=Jejubacter calystegiae TaxID=2579935 RepID=A0A4P8YIU9_9ENTR|nr:ATP-binding cassette domain-containing protein [Jejubacter calystegiae]NUU65143.1 ATP-binding cassette domain-containing protein [Enterobacteriaceae bacterium BIT-l23]QCT20631.1 ATP-binding cassette domain-containing protein [Jejubacter calystegiae]
MLSVRAVNQFYGERHVLWNVDLELAPGECTCLLGEPGAGKTTLANCITGHLPVQSGTLLWHAPGGPPEDLRNMSVARRAALGIGYLPQGRRLFTQLSVEENLHIAHRAVNTAPRAIPPLIDTLFPALYAIRHLRASALPGVLQQQLSLALALVTAPRLLILDEPLSAHPQTPLEEMALLVKRLVQEFGMTILMAECSLSFIRKVADRFCLLHRGRNLAQGRPGQLDERLLGWMAP